MKTFVFVVTMKNPEFGSLTRNFIIKADTVGGAEYQVRDWCKSLFWEVESVVDMSCDFTSIS